MLEYPYRSPYVKDCKSKFVLQELEDEYSIVQIFDTIISAHAEGYITYTYTSGK